MTEKLVLYFQNFKNSTDVVELADILCEIKNGPSLYWIIQHVEVIGDYYDNATYRKFIDTIWRKSKHYDACLPISWEAIQEFEPEFVQIIWMDLVAYKNENLIKVYEEDSDLLLNSEIAIFMIDGWNWEVYTKD